MELLAQDMSGFIGGRGAVATPTTDPFEWRDEALTPVRGWRTIGELALPLGRLRADPNHFEWRAETLTKFSISSTRD